MTPPDPYAVLKPRVCARDNQPPGASIKIAEEADWLVIEVAANAPPPLTLPRTAIVRKVTKSILAALWYRRRSKGQTRLRVVRGRYAARHYELLLPRHPETPP
jgi:hypothetical protein